MKLLNQQGKILNIKEEGFYQSVIIKDEENLNEFFRLTIFENSGTRLAKPKFVKSIRFNNYPNVDEIMYWIKRIEMESFSQHGYGAKVEKFYEIKYAEESWE